MARISADEGKEIQCSRMAQFDKNLSVWKKI